MGNGLKLWCENVQWLLQVNWINFERVVAPWCVPCLTTVKHSCLIWTSVGSLCSAQWQKCIFKSWSLLPRISSYCFHLFQNANSISPKGHQTNVFHPFWAMELPKQIYAAREVCLCKSHLDQECASFQKALKQEMDLNLTEMKTKLQTRQNCLFRRWTN